jgi:hypothetical protein
MLAGGGTKTVGQASTEAYTTTEDYMSTEASTTTDAGAMQSAKHTGCRFRMRCVQF